MSFSGYKGRNPLNLTLTRRGKNRSYCCWGKASCLQTWDDVPVSSPPPTTSVITLSFFLFCWMTLLKISTVHSEVTKRKLSLQRTIYIFFYCTSQTRWEVLRDGYSMDFPFIRNVGMKFKLMQGLIKKDPWRSISVKLWPTLHLLQRPKFPFLSPPSAFYIMSCILTDHTKKLKRKKKKRLQGILKY